jgi:hypothetical protein
LRVQAKAHLKSGKDTTQKDVAAVAVGEEPKKEDDNKMDEEKIEEPSTHILNNPSRILRTQQKFIEYLEDGRYRPLLKVSPFVSDNKNRIVKEGTSGLRIPHQTSTKHTLTNCHWRPG